MYMYYINFLCSFDDINENYRNGMVLLKYIRHFSNPEVHIGVAGSRDVCLLVRP